MMEFDEYLNQCRCIRYQHDATITEFGQPMNCYGFIYWYYKLCRGVELERSGVTSFDDIHSVKYMRVEHPEDGDVVDIKTIGGFYAYHVGIYMKGYVHHFGYNGPEAKKVDRVPHMIKGYYHGIEN